VTARPPAGRPQQGAGGYANQFARAPSIRTGGFSFGRTGSTLRPEVNEIDMSKPLHRPRKRPGRKTVPRKLTDDLSEGFAFPGVSVIQEGTQEYEEVHQNARLELHSIENNHYDSKAQNNPLAPMSVQQKQAIFEEADRNRDSADYSSSLLAAGNSGGASGGDSFSSQVAPLTVRSPRNKRYTEGTKPMGLNRTGSLRVNGSFVFPGVAAAPGTSKKIAGFEDSDKLTPSPPKDPHPRRRRHKQNSYLASQKEKAAQGELESEPSSLFGFDMPAPPIPMVRTSSLIGKKGGTPKRWKEVYPGVWLPEEDKKGRRSKRQESQAALDAGEQAVKDLVVKRIVAGAQDKDADELVEVYPGVFVNNLEDEEWSGHEQVLNDIIEKCEEEIEPISECFPGVSLPTAEAETPPAAPVDEGETGAKKKKKRVGWRDLGPRRMVEVFPGVWLPVGENERAEDLVQDVLFFEKGSADAQVWGEDEKAKSLTMSSKRRAGSLAEKMSKMRQAARIANEVAQQTAPPPGTPGSNAGDYGL